MPASILFVQLDELPRELPAYQCASPQSIFGSLGLSSQHVEWYCFSPHKPVPCIKHKPVIILGGLWSNSTYLRLPSRLFQWLHKARTDACPIFAFGFAHLVVNSVFGGVNLQPQTPGLKTVYKQKNEKDFLTSSLPAKFNSWTICNTKSCTPPKTATVLAESHSKEPMLIRFNERTYSTPLSLSLSWSGIAMWLHDNPQYLAGNEPILDARMDTTLGLSILANFLKLWWQCPCSRLLSGGQSCQIHQSFHQC